MRKVFLLPPAILLGVGFFFLSESARFWVDTFVSVSFILLAMYAFFKYMVPVKVIVNDIYAEMHGLWFDVKYLFMYPFIRRDHDRTHELGGIPMHHWETRGVEEKTDEQT